MLHMPMLTYLLNDNEQSFDRLFGIARCSSSDAFAIGSVWGLIPMLHEVCRPPSFIQAETSALVSCFFRLDKIFILPMASEGMFVVDAGNAASCPSSHPLIKRFKKGHQTFVPLTCGLVFTHVRAIAAIESRNATEASAVLRDARCLFAASVAAMHWAGELTPHEYEGVRAQMSPPHVPKGFSGMFNADHRCLLMSRKTWEPCSIGSGRSGRKSPGRATNTGKH
ncbi:hypothetical protein HJB96_32250 [Rhizobium sp. NLR15a]|nr:hypothetical protein [Rhizobium sp. NLR15a]MBX5297528.1 hypothetical protein [Rhizobium sp. NLR15a]